jgi:hypothetical protein
MFLDINIVFPTVGTKGYSLQGRISFCESIESGYFGCFERVC